MTTPRANQISSPCLSAVAKGGSVSAKQIPQHGGKQGGSIAAALNAL